MPTRLLIVFILFAEAALAQPPALGPLPPQGASPYLPVFAFVNTVSGSLQAALDTVNARIIRNSPSTGVRAHVSFSYTTHKPQMSVTQYPDRPNENIVKIPFMISYDVTGIRYHGIPYFSRKLGQSLDVFISCNNWFTNAGKLKTVMRADRPYLDANSFGEEALNFFVGHVLTDMVDSEIRRILPDAVTASTSSPFSCNQLGVTSGTAPGYTDGQVNYKKVQLPMTVASALNASITFQNIKRLPARTLSGEILYNQSENIQLEVYGNHASRTVQLSDMKEGDVRNLSFGALDLGRLGNNAKLLVLCNVEQLSSFQKESGFRVFTRGTNFGNGIQKIIIKKIYWEQPRRLPGGGWSRPIQRLVDAYEITALIYSPQSVIGYNPGEKGQYLAMFDTEVRNMNNE